MENWKSVPHRVVPIHTSRAAWSRPPLWAQGHCQGKWCQWMSSCAFLKSLITSTSRCSSKGTGSLASHSSGLKIEPPSGWWMFWREPGNCAGGSFLFPLAACSDKLSAMTFFEKRSRSLRIGETRHGKLALEIPNFVHFWFLNRPGLDI